MDTACIHLGLSTVCSRVQADGAGDADFQRKMRRIEAGAATLNLDPAQVYLAVEIAALEKDLEPPSRHALVLLIVASMIALQEGSTRLPVTGNASTEALRRILTPLCDEENGRAATAAAAGAIEALLHSGAATNVIARDPGEFKPLLYLRPFIYQQRVRAAELRLAERLRPRLDDPRPLCTESALSDALRDVLARPGFRDDGAIILSEEQRAAVVNAASRRLAIISGGPGTGKTSIVLAVLRVLVRIGISPGDIMVAAPTGKAAFRMGESIRRGLSELRNPGDADRALIEAQLEPATVHRVLGSSRGGASFIYQPNNPLPASALIVDESSMLDLILMERLIGAIRPDARLIMLGDADQLPSVAAGAVFRDLIAAADSIARAGSAQICTRLTHSYRLSKGAGESRSIFNLANRINNGSLEGKHGEPLYQERSRLEGLCFAGVELVDCNEAGIAPFLDRWFETHIRDKEIDSLKHDTYREGAGGFDGATSVPLKRMFDHAMASRILCATRVLATGTERINHLMHRRAMAEMGQSPDRFGFLPGDPVIVNRNDYDRMLFNGDQGLIVRVQRQGARPALMAVFERGGAFAAFQLATIAESLELCHATTIHKAQGSEFKAVAIVIPENDVPLLTRELMYTAVSRAMEAVTLVGSKEIMRTAVARMQNRFSGLRELLETAGA
jgi:exodeoxyribonuclease V alpha subunit